MKGLIFGKELKLPNLVIYNDGTELEFAECSVCGHEINPPKYDVRWKYIYPARCPKCKTQVHKVLAEDVMSEELKFVKMPV